MASGDVEQRSGLAEAAGRAAFFPARAAARAWREQLEAAVDEMLSAPEIARVIDRALAGPLPEEIARSVVRHRRATGARSRRLGGAGLPASSCRLRLLERVETLLERRHTTVKRIDRPQPAGDITEALLDPVHHPTRSLDNPSERVLADVRKLRDHVPVVRALLRGHDLTIAPPGTHLDVVPEAADA